MYRRAYDQSLALHRQGRPFTLPYAREQVDPAYWNSPRFLRTNYIITAVWAGAFAVILAADVAALLLPNLPSNVGFNANILAVFGAGIFTTRYAKRASHAAAEVRFPQGNRACAECVAARIVEFAS